MRRHRVHDHGAGARNAIHHIGAEVDGLAVARDPLAAIVREGVADVVARGERPICEVDVFLLRLTILLALSTLITGSGARAVQQHLAVGAGPDSSPSGAFQARLGVYPLNANLAEPLLRLTPDFKLEPLLATKWEYRGANTWRFYLRKDVQFHDGQPLTAEAVRWSLENQVKGGFVSFPIAANAVRVVDDHTVDITTTEPDLRLPEQLVHPNYSIFALGSDPKTKPIGTGAFRLVEYLPYDRLSVARNETYWGEKARLDRITFRFFPDATTRVLALLAGEVDLIVDLPRQQIGSIAGNPELLIARAPVGQVMSLQLNAHGKEPHTLLGDRKLRRAIGHALDREQLVKGVWRGEAAALTTMTVPAVLGTHAALVKGIAFDRTKAAALLDEGGWLMQADGLRAKAGHPLRLTMIANPEIDAAAVQLIQAQLRAVGIDLRWDRLPDIATFAARGTAGACDLNLASANQNDLNPLFLPALIYYSKSLRPFVRWYAVGPAFDRIVESGLRAEDPDEARRLAAEAMRLAIDVEAINLPLAGLFRIYGLKRSVEGFVPHPAQTHQDWTRVHRK